MQGWTIFPWFASFPLQPLTVVTLHLYRPPLSVVRGEKEQRERKEMKWDEMRREYEISKYSLSLRRSLQQEGWIEAASWPEDSAEKRPRTNLKVSKVGRVWPGETQGNEKDGGEREHEVMFGVLLGTGQTRIQGKLDASRYQLQG
jgi:hypothetical protein